MSENRARILPNDLAAEQSLLGCMFISRAACADIIPSLMAEDFYSNAHKKIYEAMYDNYRKDVAIDYVTVSDVLTKKGQLEEVGGLGYLADLTNAVPSAANYKHYLDIIKNHSVIRRVIDVCTDTINYAFESGDCVSVLSRAEKEILDISKTQEKSDLVHIRKGVNEAIDIMEKLAVDPNAFNGVKTGFPRLDTITHGFKSGDLIILAARPGIGKTTLAVNIANNAAIKYGKTVAIFDLEMSVLQVAQRVLCSTGRVPMDLVKSGTKDNNVWNTIFETKKILEDSNIYVDDTTTITPAEIKSKCRRLKQQVGLDLIIIDYLQLMKGEGGGKEVNRQQEVADLTRSIKLAARELDCPIILLSQLNRDSEKRVDKKPQLSDLRESGSIEQDADIVMFISDTPADDAKDNADTDDGAIDYSLIIAKHRNGMRDTIPLKWKSEYTQFYEPGKDILFTRNFSKVQKDKTVLTPVENSDIDDVFKE